MVCVCGCGGGYRVQGSTLVDQKTLTCKSGIQSCRCCVKRPVTETALLLVHLYKLKILSATFTIFRAICTKSPTHIKISYKRIFTTL